MNSKEHSFKSVPKKQLGQHFLTSTYHAERIAQSIPARGDEEVLEIGPGEGALSAYLVKRFPRMHLVEIDRDVIPRLKSRLGEGKWQLHCGNVLDFNFLQVGIPLHVTGNLPYNIGAHIIKKTLYHGSNIASCTFMVQREVAQRIVSEPQTKNNGFLSIFCQFFGQPRILFNVPPGAFFPKPNVESSVFQIVIDKPEERLSPESWSDFFSFVDRGFAMRRKQLAKTLGYTDGRKEMYRVILEELGLSSTVRPEELSVSQWLSLYKKASR